MRYKITEKVGDVEVSYEAFTVKGAHELADHKNHKDLTECSVVELLEALREKARSEGGHLAVTELEYRPHYEPKSKVDITLLTDTFDCEDYERFQQ